MVEGPRWGAGTPLTEWHWAIGRNGGTEHTRVTFLTSV
jgi:hypothetical protein